jgi:hypothetical protein
LGSHIPQWVTVAEKNFSMVQTLEGARNRVPDPKSNAYDKAIARLRSISAEYERRFQRYYKDEQRAISALEAARKNGGIVSGNSFLFRQDNPFYTDAQGHKIYTNPEGHIGLSALPALLAHEGTHLALQLPAGYESERRAYDVEFGVRSIIGPYEPRRTDAQIYKQLGESQ